MVNKHVVFFSLSKYLFLVYILLGIIIINLYGGWLDITYFVMHMAYVLYWVLLIVHVNGSAYTNNFTVWLITIKRNKFLTHIHHISYNCAIYSIWFELLLSAALYRHHPSAWFGHVNPSRTLPPISNLIVVCTICSKPWFPFYNLIQNLSLLLCDAACVLFVQVRNVHIPSQCIHDSSNQKATTTTIDFYHLCW